METTNLSSKKSQFMVTEQLARSPKGLVQYDLPGATVLRVQFGQFLKDKIILECLVSCSRKFDSKEICPNRMEERNQNSRLI